ncbi:hypothetical protein SKAU_G00212500 [Synaphobranchus kaupii]|uniref:Uncharacterized protein n=1 Tax=Synaphobranchus kaupii TaxID=118154 RepID=A0A9Q1F9L6_SYNKA|nr:hypothetical protein SKAU_G00212500 [Synaphobranchus kaupii]
MQTTPPPPSLSISADQVRSEVRCLHPSKAAGPDGISPKVLKFAYQTHIGVYNAIIFLLHRAYSHLEKAGSTATVCMTPELYVRGGGEQYWSSTGDSPVSYSVTSTPQDFCFNLSGWHLLKFSDDSSIVGCIDKGDEEEFN